MNAGTPPSAGHLSRRTLLRAAALAPALAACRTAPARGDAPRPQVADIHVHLFGTGAGGTGCFVSDEIRRGFLFVYLVRQLGIGGADALDRAFVARLRTEAAGSGVDRIAVVGQDAVYDADGVMDRDRTAWYVPNEHLLSACADDPRLLPCVSINPGRRDARDELARCVEAGARVMKIHPPTQGVDLRDRRHDHFLQAVADADVLLIVHTGHEHAAPVLDPTFCDPRQVERALGAGCRVVAAHAGTGRPTDTPDHLPTFVALARRHPRLWADTSILCAPGRARDLRRLLELEDLRDAFVHGSDWPFPSVPGLFAADLPDGRAVDLAREPNGIRRDLALKTALGLDASAPRAARLLAGTEPDRPLG